MQAEETHLLLLTPPGEEPVDVPGPALLRRLAVGEGHEHAVVLDLEVDLRDQHRQQGKGDPRGDRGEHGGHGHRRDNGP